MECDQCFFSLRPPEYIAVTGQRKGKVAPYPEYPVGVDLRIRKRTRLRANCPALGKLACRCDGKHEHFVAQGSIKVQGKWMSAAKCAGAYPPSLCKQWASLVSEAVAAR